MNNEPKFCVNCRWCRAITAENGVGYICAHDVSEADKRGSKWDLVTGQPSSPLERYRACATMREFNKCGPDAKLWEAKV